MSLLSPPPLPDWTTAAHLVIDAGRQAFQRGWLPATSGNLSVRAAEGRIAITRSGVDKGALAVEDILAQPVDNALLPGSSAEAALHLQRYRDDPQTGAVWHTHSTAAAVLGRVHEHQGAITIQGWELQKALRGIRTHETTVTLPVFANTQDIDALAVQVSQRFSAPAAHETLAPGYLIAGHGLYAWGHTAAEAWRHLEALDTLLNQLLALNTYTRASTLSIATP